MRICPIDQLVKLQSEGYGFDNVLNQRRAEFSNVDNHLWSRPLHLNVRRQVSIKTASHPSSQYDITIAISIDKDHQPT
jgi:hypothetical protein